jgi:hypothetical protein
MLVLAQAPPSQMSVVQPLPSPQSPSVVHSGWSVVDVVLDVVEVLDVEDVDDVEHVVEVLVVVGFGRLVLVVVVVGRTVVVVRWPSQSPARWRR